MEYFAGIWLPKVQKTKNHQGEGYGYSFANFFPETNRLSAIE